MDNEEDGATEFDPSMTVIVEVLGGVVQETTSPKFIHTIVVDYDNFPDAEIEYFLDERKVEMGRIKWGAEA